MDTKPITVNYSKRTKTLAVKFRYGISPYGFCHISFNMVLVDACPSRDPMWVMEQLEMHWETCKPNLYLQHLILSSLIEIDYHCLGSIKTMSALEAICAGKHTVDYCISYDIQNEFKKYLRATKKTLLDYALDEFKAEVTPV